MNPIFECAALFVPEVHLVDREGAVLADASEQLYEDRVPVWGLIGGQAKRVHCRVASRMPV